LFLFPFDNSKHRKLDLGFFRQIFSAVHYRLDTEQTGYKLMSCCRYIHGNGIDLTNGEMFESAEDR
jgi:hypothetical protein